MRRLGQIPILGFSQHKLVWLYKQNLEAFPCYKRAGNKHTRVSSWRFFVVVLVCFPDGQAVFPSLRTAPACSLRWLDPPLGRPGFLREVQGSGEAGKASGLAVPWGDSLADERRLGA